MLQLTFRNLRANKLRLALTTVAVVLGVSFVVSSFVLTDGLRQSFGSLSEEIVGATDLEVRPAADFGNPTPFPAEVAETVAATEGVDRAAGQLVGDNVKPVRADGTVLDGSGAPLFGFSWVDDPGLSTFTVVEGRAPEAGMEFTMDLTTATDEGFVVGETYEVVTVTGTHELTLVGVTRFGAENQTLGATLTQYPRETAELLLDKAGLYDTVLVALDDGVDSDAVVDRLEAALPGTVQVLDREALIDDTQAGFDQGISILNNILLGFALVSLFVSIFIIANTFAIVFGQRTRDLAMLRAIGASVGQVRASTLGEAAVLGVVASVLGIGGGVLLAVGLTGLFALLGAELPDAPLVVSTRTTVVALTVGVGVTVLSAIGPARRASRVAPMAAINGAADRPTGVSARRTTIGVVIALGGAALGGFGLFGDAGSVAGVLAAIGFGSVAVFLGVMLAGSAITNPVLSVVGRPIRWLGTAGVLSNQNATRNPGRTTATAASLMVGLTLVTMALVVGESFKQGVGDTLASTVRADYITSSDTSISPTFVEQVSALDEFDEVAGYRYTEARFDGEVRGVIGTDIEATAELFNLDVVDGRPSNDGGSVLVYEAEAEAEGLAVGDTVAVEFPGGTTEDLTVAAIFADPIILEEPYVVSLADWNERFGPAPDNWAAAKVADGVDPDAAQAALNPVLDEFTDVRFEQRDAFQESLESEVDSLLVVVNAMLVLALFIALIGIANTLALSVVERTREIGLLRAVGMTRRQSRRMIRWEAVQIALFGSLLGVALGIGFGTAAVAALPEDFIGTLAIPTTRIVILVAACALAGLVAAAFPARRASRLDVLEAIAM